MPSEGAATVASGDIARLAGVGRAAVSNWRRRFADFPQPVGGSSASPLYALFDVENWLRRHGKPYVVTAPDRVWQSLRGAAADRELSDRIGHVGGFLVALKREPQGWKAVADQPDSVLIARLVGVVRACVPELDGLLDAPDLDNVTIVRLAAEAAEREGGVAVLQFLWERYLEVHSRRHAVTPAWVADLMIALAGAAGGRLLDPACGFGTLLLAGQRAGATSLCGQEANRTAARLAVSRLLLQADDATLVTGDSLCHDGFTGELFDAVVCNPPFGQRSWEGDDLTNDARWEHGMPPRGEPELAWLQHCLAHIRPGGHVAILMPAGAASRRAGRRIRANLLRSGALRAVIRLPGWGTTAPSGPDLWVLRRPDGVDHAQVLLLDATIDRDGIEDRWRSFLGDPTRVGGAGRAMRIIDLLDEDVDLTPARHLATQAITDAETFRLARARLHHAVRAVADTLPGLTVPDAAEPQPRTTIGELTKAGAVAIRQAPMAMPTDGGDQPVLTAKDVRLGRPASGAGRDGPGGIVLRRGDIVVLPSGRHPAVRVLSEDGSLLGPQLLLFRVDPNRLDPDFLAGFLRVAQTARASTGSGRADLHRASVLRLPIEAQREYGKAFRTLSAFQQSVRDAAELAESLVALGFTGLADGRLRLTGSSA
ncbi:type I restriction-modification system DNA methylase subunit [Asanoa ferruginea]|uniref:Type I restriction-modification system DNA methylase subunit n=1 Tax=Asanoa ferruginea TaxID=53367 RepID=A0A3D9ZJ92_9ACTN|nr:N-6 DNA methylase [Asanoa ferruginea]REF97506.1 type I restriction-modification system DNA methylase subunit [Asanoa ferruginea]GIF48206.1 type II restriction endonuclease subunit M [Asanoa ferruginea]